MKYEDTYSIVLANSIFIYLFFFSGTGTLMDFLLYFSCLSPDLFTAMTISIPHAIDTEYLTGAFEDRRDGLFYSGAVTRATHIHLLLI